MLSIDFFARVSPFIPMVEFIGECKKNEPVRVYIAGVFGIIDTAEKHQGRLMGDKPKYMPRWENEVIFSFTVIFPNMEERNKFLKEQVIVDITGPK